MTLAVCLLTADRSEYTATTLRSFGRFNPDATRDGTILLHADDGSQGEDIENLGIAIYHGFETVYRTERRMGQGRALNAMWSEAIRRGATRILHLENDQEWVAPIPMNPELARFSCVRLYGELKMREGKRAPTGKRDLGSGQLVEWLPFGDLPGWEAGHVHWGGQPSITSAALLMNAAAGQMTIKAITMSLSCLTARPRENITWHIGHTTTPDRAT